MITFCNDSSEFVLHEMKFCVTHNFSYFRLEQYYIYKSKKSKGIFAFCLLLEIHLKRMDFMSTFVYNHHIMNEKKAIEKLQAIANQPEDSLRKFLAKEILTYGSPREFFSLVKDFGMETLYQYEDLEEEEIQKILTDYSKEIEQMQLNNSDKPLSDTELSWSALEKTAKDIRKDLDLEW